MAENVLKQLKENGIDMQEKDIIEFVELLQPLNTEERAEVRGMMIGIRSTRERINRISQKKIPKNPDTG